MQRLTLHPFSFCSLNLFFDKIIGILNKVCTIMNVQCSLGLSPPRFIANLTYRQNSRLSRFPPLKIPRYTAKLSYRHPPQVFRHKSRKTNLNFPVSTAPNYLLTAVY